MSGAAATGKVWMKQASISVEKIFIFISVIFLYAIFC
jgi:hypothetical protein